MLEEFLQCGAKDGHVPELTFEQVPFNHPLYIMYSSGTTGVPKCMVHSVGVGSPYGLYCFSFTLYLCFFFMRKTFLLRNKSIGKKNRNDESMSYKSLKQ